jgi:transmembrane sensor
MKFNLDEISQLVYERIAGTISDEDNAALQHALDSDDEFRQLYKEISNNLKLHEFVYQIDEQSAWGNLKAKLSDYPRKASKNVASLQRILSYAAIGLIMSASAFYFFYNYTNRTSRGVKIVSNNVELELATGMKIALNGSSKKVIYAGNIKLNTGLNELSFKSSSSTNTALNTLVIPKKVTYKVILSDGTSVLLNSTSKLRFPMRFKGPNREVYLEGEGYFKVSKNVKVPFIVHTRLTDIKVLGTVFNVSTYEHNTVTTSLLEGSVSTSSKNNHALKLQPGRQAKYSPQTGFTETNFQSARVVSWVNGVYNFHDTPLKEIAPIIERWFDVKLNFASGEVADLKITGTIDKNQSLGTFLHNVQLSANLNSVVKSRQVILSRIN